MSTVETVVTVTHLLFAGLWTGAVAFVAWRVVPLLRDGDVGVDAAASILSGLRTLTRGSALVLLLTGGHMAASRYSPAELTGNGEGHLVLTMVVLWIALTGLVEAGSARALDPLDEGLVRTAGNDSRRLFTAAAAVALALLVVAGLLV